MPRVGVLALATATAAILLIFLTIHTIQSREASDEARALINIAERMVSKLQDVKLRTAARLTHLESRTEQLLNLVENRESTYFLPCQVAIAGVAQSHEGATLASAANACAECRHAGDAHLRACHALAWQRFRSFFQLSSSEDHYAPLFHDGNPSRQVVDPTWLTGERAKHQFVYGSGSFELANWAVLEHEAFPLCNDSDTPSALVVNVGANDGFYSWGASGARCRVVAFEPQGGCVPWLFLNNIVNHHRHAVDLRVAAVAPKPMVFETGSTCHGGTSYRKEGEVIVEDEEAELTKLTVPSVRLDDVVGAVHADVQADAS